MAKVKHIALIKFKEGTSTQQIDQLFDALLELTENVEGVEDYVSGTNNSPEALNKGLTHGFVMSFHDAASRDAYLTHPDHEAVKSKFLPIVEDIIIFDFEV
jgi:hypothetical protein